MWHNLFYFGSGLKAHVVSADLAETIQNHVQEQYSCLPEKIEAREELFLDPGGMICTKVEPLKVQDNIFVNPEHVLYIIDSWNLAKEVLPNIYKIYLNQYQVLFLSKDLYLKIGAWLVQNKALGYAARSELIAALSGSAVLTPPLPKLEEN